MTEAATKDDAVKLTPFEGLDVIGTTIAIRNAGDGLSAAMDVDPIELHHGEKVYVVLECLVEKIRHDPVDKDRPGGPQLRVHMLKAGRATMVDGDDVTAALDAQQKRIDDAKGTPQLDLDGAGAQDSPRTGMASVASIVGRVGEVIGAPADAQLGKDCATCGGPVEDGVCLLQECDVVEADDGEGDDPPADPDAAADDATWEDSARAEPAGSAPVTIDDLIVDDAVQSKALRDAQVSEVLAIVGAVEGDRRWAAERILAAEKSGKARATLIGGLEALLEQGG